MIGLGLFLDFTVTYSATVNISYVYLVPTLSLRQWFSNFIQELYIVPWAHFKVLQSKTIFMTLKHHFPFLSFSRKHTVFSIGYTACDDVIALTTNKYNPYKQKSSLRSTVIFKSVKGGPRLKFENCRSRVCTQQWNGQVVE